MSFCLGLDDVSLNLTTRKEFGVNKKSGRKDKSCTPKSISRNLSKRSTNKILVPREYILYSALIDEISRAYAESVGNSVYFELSCGSVSPQKKKLLKKFMRSNQDLISLVVELSTQLYEDRIIYGYYPWDYVREMELNLEEQGYV